MIMEDSMSGDEDFKSEKNQGELRALVLTIPTRWMIIDEIVDEVRGAREAARIKPFYVPMALIQPIVNALVQEHELYGRPADKGVVYRLNRKHLIERRARVVHALIHEDDNSQLAPKLAAKALVSQVDVDELVEQGREDGERLLAGDLAVDDGIAEGIEGVPGDGGEDAGEEGDQGSDLHGGGSRSRRR